MTTPARVAMLAVLSMLALAPAAHAAAKICPEPGAQFDRATPAEAGMDAVKLAAAVDFGSQNGAYAVRVHRRGCLVAEDRGAAANRGSQYETWSLSKSLVSIIFGRAMTLGLISPDDPVGSLVPEADAAHGKITMRDLLTMTSGLRWNGFRDYNIAMQDRLLDALTVETARPPGTYFEYAQSAVALLSEAITRAVGEDAAAFAQREVMTPLGIPEGSWRWVRDGKGRIQGFFGVNMRPDDMSRLGDLLRRGGVWRGRRLLSLRYVRESLMPSANNACYGWLIWLNVGKPCIGPRVQGRPVKMTRSAPTLPPDMYRFSGLFGQIVAVFPTQDVVITRTGTDPQLINLAGGQAWEVGLHERVLTSITDEKVPVPADATATPPPAPDDPGDDAGFQTVWNEPQEYGKGPVQGTLPPAGPARARALRMRLAHPAASRAGGVAIRVTCPARWPGRDAQPCTGTATLDGARVPVSYRYQPGASGLLRFTLMPARLRSLRGAGGMNMTAAATNDDATGGAPARIGLRLRAPR